MEKTDLKKIFAISGQRGLFRYLAQGNAGLIVEHLETKARTQFGGSAKVSSLGDISIYTIESEMTLKQVLRNMAEKLSNAPAMSSKSDPKAIKAFFGEVIPDYDADRFYVSHMKKVLDWYNELQKFATLDFEDDEEEQAETEQEA